MLCYTVSCSHFTDKQLRKRTRLIIQATSAVLTICILHHVYSVHLFYCTFVSSFKSTHLLSPLLITVAKIPPVAYYPSKDVATYLSRSRSRSSESHLWAIIWRCLRDSMFSRFGTVLACDRWTSDRQTHDYSIYRSSIASCGKNRSCDPDHNPFTGGLAFVG